MMSALESFSVQNADSDCAIIGGENDALDGGAVVNYIDAVVDTTRSGGVEAADEDNDGINEEAAENSNDENDDEHYNTESSIGIAFGSPSASTSTLIQDTSSLVPSSATRLHKAHSNSSTMIAISAVSQHLDEDMREKIDYMLEYSFSKALRSNIMWTKPEDQILNQKNLMRNIVKYLSPILRQHLGQINRKREEILSIEATIVLAFMKTEYCRNLNISMERFLENYPQFLSPAVNDTERAKLHEFCNCVIVVQILIPAKNNKEHLLDLVSRMTEGFFVRRITGTGMTFETRNRYDIIHQEAGLIPQNRLDKRKREENNIEFSALEVSNQDGVIMDSKRAYKCLDDDNNTNRNDSSDFSSSNSNRNSNSNNNSGGGDQISYLDRCLDDSSNSNSNSNSNGQRSTSSNNSDSKSPLSLNRQNSSFAAVGGQGLYRDANSGSVSPKTPLTSPSGLVVKSNRGRPRSIRLEGEDQMVSRPSMFNASKSRPLLRLQEEEAGMTYMYHQQQQQQQQQHQLSPLGISQALSLAASVGLRGAPSYSHSDSNNSNNDNNNNLLPFNFPTHVSSSSMMPINLSSLPTSSYGSQSSGLPGINYTLASMNSSLSMTDSGYDYNIPSSNSLLNPMQSIDADANKLLILLQAGIGPN